MAGLLTAALLAASSAWAAFPPRVDVQRLAGKTPPPTAAGFVAVGDCFTPLAFGEVKELAIVSVFLPQPWPRTAEHVAKQAAAELGANCLLPLEAYGPEGPAYPVVRRYRAFFVTTVVAGAMGTFRIPASPRAFRPAPRAEGAAPIAASTAAARVERGVAYGPLWYPREPLESHEIELDLSRMPPAEWERVRADLAAHFSPADVERLAYARARGLPVTIDLERRRLLVPEGQAAWDLPPGKLMEEQP